MKKKIYKFEDGKMKDEYIKEIKDLLKNNPKVDTEAGFDRNGNYVITLKIPDWKDKLKIGKTPQIDNFDKNIRRNSKQYGNYQETKGYQKYNIR